MEMPFISFYVKKVGKFKGGVVSRVLTKKTLH